MSQPTKILLIYTGGTIGMIKDPVTNSLKAFNFDQLLSNIPELKLLSHKINTLSFKNPKDSSDFNCEDYINLATIIEANYENYDGFVVLHGSDTMSYTASAISFMLENLTKPVIFTGSQLPIGDLRTDAKENLITSIQIAGLRKGSKSLIQEVGLYFEYKLYRANRTTKINAEHFEAFSSLNFPAIIESGVNLNINHSSLIQQKPKQLKVHKKLDNNIIIIKVFPGLNEATFNHLVNTPNIKGIILETFGSGNTKTEDWFLKVIKKAIDNGIHVVNITQCSGGSVEMGKYATSKHLLEAGLIDGKDMTTEAAVGKMMFLLPKKLDKNVFKTIFETSLRGEMK
ncbi:asparaginase [Psychroflexus sp. ALD_RP9]|uniref:asparaginase n=1 Tax=Psychroflexus sp. ALD_RP9 TaxID=2777186 RepID=UPI001A8DD2AA|nr:asparaginase [Psychroflexus sp. ALD_RP9]QSS97776.1 asparaginase [Psychroflexus sp. ALD_RP9]